MINKKKQGFTLIELLVVIAIIGVLTALSMFAINNSRIAARDAKRKADLASIQAGLEIYHSDCNSYPPAVSGQVPYPLKGDGSTGCATTNIYISTHYIDPVPTQSYTYTLVGAGYSLCATFEQPAGTSCVTNP